MLWNPPGLLPIDAVGMRRLAPSAPVRALPHPLSDSREQLGCVTAFNAPSEARNLGSGVDLAELGMKTVTEVGLWGVLGASVRAQTARGWSCVSGRSSRTLPRAWPGWLTAAQWLGLCRVRESCWQCT